MKKIRIIAADFNKEIVNKMIETAAAEIESKPAQLVETIRLPGCYEIPYVLHKSYKKDVDAVVVLGYIEKGETLHGEVMGHVVHSELVTMQQGLDLPIGLGIVGPGATVEQARVRAEKSARSAVESVFTTLEVTKRN